MKIIWWYDLYSKIDYVGSKINLNILLVLLKRVYTLLSKMFMTIQLELGLKTK